MHMYIGLAKDIEVRGKPLQLEWIYTIFGHKGSSSGIRDVS